MSNNKLIATYFVVTGVMVLGYLKFLKDLAKG